MTHRLWATTLALALCVLMLAVGCGKYGPPVRSHGSAKNTAPATARSIRDGTGQVSHDLIDDPHRPLKIRGRT